jgi:hypothetical protein
VWGGGRRWGRGEAGLRYAAGWPAGAARVALRGAGGEVRSEDCRRARMVLGWWIWALGLPYMD